MKHVNDFQLAERFNISPKEVIGWEPAFKRDVITWANAEARAERTRRIRDGR